MPLLLVPVPWFGKNWISMLSIIDKQYTKGSSSVAPLFCWGQTMFVHEIVSFLNLMILAHLHGLVCKVFAKK